LAKSQPFSVVLRISDVTMAKTALEAAVQIKLDRFEPARSGTLHYAQLNLPAEECRWTTVVDWIKKIGPQISALRRERLIGPATIDLAIPFRPPTVSMSIEMPSYAAETISRYGIDIKFSVYLTNEDES
jgi:hypothetical protein